MFRSSQRGMTPTETLIAAVVVAGIALLLVTRLTEEPTGEARNTTIERITTLMDALEKYAIDNGGLFPTTDQGLEALLHKPVEEPVPHRYRGPYIDSSDTLIDGWGVPFHYVSPGGERRPYDLWSNGADRAEGGEDENADVQSWNRDSLIP